MSLRLLLVTAAGILVATVAGCGGGGGTTRYVPDEAPAQSALETALQAWQSGEDYGPIESSTPAINIVDARWQSGAKLESFEVLDAGAEGDGPRQFQVRMKLAGQPEETVTYLVVGIDPLHIFREQDYQKATGM
jgi:hypothetical protein